MLSVSVCSTYIQSSYSSYGGFPEPIFLANGLQCWGQNQLPLMPFGVRAALCVDIVLKSMLWVAVQ